MHCFYRRLNKTVQYKLRNLHPSMHLKSMSTLKVQICVRPRSGDQVYRSAEATFGSEFIDKKLWNAQKIKKKKNSENKSRG